MGVPCKEPWIGGNISSEYVEVVNKETKMSIIGQKTSRPGMWIVFVNHVKLVEIPRGEIIKSFKCLMEKIGQNVEINVKELIDECF